MCVRASRSKLLCIYISRKVTITVKILYNNYIRSVFMGLSQPVVTQQMVIAELTKAGIKRDIAIDLSYRYYKNELTYKDIEFLKENFDIKLEKVEATLQTKIQRVETNLKSDIRDLDNKINTVENNLNTKIDTKFNDLDNKIDNVRSELKSDIKDLDTKIDVNKMELKSTLRLHGWMFGTLITLNIGIFLALMSLLVK
ncbi:Borrelia Direct Repeat protein 3 (plasmid) [Borrelia turicatae 91E135]|uniref:Borrelia Direct Repeat protein 3 n=2 Tax=Borrelia turicatae TaxID=142 RepID=A0ABF7R071_BORT9|nr:Borrelia Direct Repeat protein 3 [Borrelia turicatae 91E135]